MQLCIYDIDASHLPVNAKDHQHVGGQDEASSPDHHEDLAHHVAGIPLNSCSPDSLHGEGDEAGDGIRYGQVEDKVVHIGAAPAIRFRKKSSHGSIRQCAILSMQPLQPLSNPHRWKILRYI